MRFDDVWVWEVGLDEVKKEEIGKDYWTRQQNTIHRRWQQQSRANATFAVYTFAVVHDANFTGVPYFNNSGAALGDPRSIQFT
jgi:hypothetical protein